MQANSATPNIPRILAATARYDLERAAGPALSPVSADDERPLPRLPTREAMPYLRQLFELAGDPTLEGNTRGMPISIPADLREFVTGYMRDHGWAVTYSMGDDSKESRVLLTRAEAA
jgi:hypothetical protein